jgi:hypothetical protein
MGTDLEELRALDMRIPDAETKGDVAFFQNLLAPAFAFRNPGRGIDDRESFLSKVAAGAVRKSELLGIDILSHQLAIVSGIVTVTIESTSERSVQRLHNTRLFVRDSEENGWMLMAWANESLALSERWLTPVADHLYGRRREHDLELWKHHASFGGEDKSRMVSVASWLLGLSAVILWYVATQLISSDPFKLHEPARAVMVSAIGVGVSLAAGYVALLYGGYANRNWKEADDIARRRGWDDLWLPENRSEISRTNANGTGFASSGRKHFASGRRKLNAWAWKCSTSTEPADYLAPVFEAFLLFALVALAAHLAIVAWSLGGLL